jgi:outer membrane autotransporter protein
VNLSTNGFTERGGAAALTGRSANANTAFTTLGVHAATDLNLGGVKAALKGTLGWRHALGDVRPATTMALAGGAPFTIAGVPIARNAAVIDLGLNLEVAKNATLAVSYQGQFGRGITDNGAKVTFNMKF